MLRFFRTIRQNLIENGNVRRYTWYALGEIGLVVIGILIALQINNWNEANKDFKISIEYHERLVSDIDQLISRLDSEIERSSEITIGILQAVRVLEDGIENDSTRNELDYGIQRRYQMSPLSFELSSYEEMKSTGRLNLIYNIELRESLNNYSSFSTIISRITDQLSANVNGSSELFNQYVRVNVEEGNNVTLQYNFNAISKDQLLINTLSMFSYEWDSYKYFVEMIKNQLHDLKDSIQTELDQMDT